MNSNIFPNTTKAISTGIKGISILPRRSLSRGLGVLQPQSAIGYPASQSSLKQRVFSSRTPALPTGILTRHQVSILA